MDLRIAVNAAGQVCMDGRLVSAPGTVVEILYHPDFAFVPARSHPLTRDQLEVQIRKTGDTAFVIRDCALEYDGSLFAPVGELNRMRREFLARAEAALLASAIPPDEDVARARERLAAAFAIPAEGVAPDKSTGSLPGLVVYADTREAVSAAAAAGCSAICFEPAFPLPRHTCGTGTEHLPPYRDQAADAMEACRKAGIRFIMKLPQITRDGDLAVILPEIARLHEEGLAECVADSPGVARAIGIFLPGMTFVGGTGLNIFNHRTACCLSPQFRSLTLSPELSGNECRELVSAARTRGCTAAFSLVVQGIGDAMITEDCLREPVQHCRPGGNDGLFHGIRDETGHIFPLRTDGACRTWIGNAVETCLVDHLPAILKAGIGSIVIDARGRPGAYAGAMVRIYREALGRIDAGTFGKEEAGSLREQAKALSYGGITAGHFLRGLKE